MVNKVPAVQVLTLATLLLVGATAGCTFKQVSPEVLKAPPQKYPLLVVGDITCGDPLWEPLVPHFRRGLVTRLKEQKAFDEVMDSAPTPLPEGALYFSGKISEVEKGSAALRWIVGFGAGKAHVSGSFELHDAGGQSLAKLTASESYLGGAGLGGAGYLDMEDLMGRFGESTADRIVKWSRGEKLE